MPKLRSIFRRALTSTLALVIGLAAAQAQADIIPSMSRDDFHSAVSSIPIENWDEYSSGHIINNNSTHHGITYTYVPDGYLPVLDFGGFLVTSQYYASTGPNTLGRIATNPSDSTDPINSQTYFLYDGIQFGFQDPIPAFAIDISTDATLPGTFTAIVNNDLTVVYTSVFDPFATDTHGNQVGQFIGFISPVEIYSVTIAYDRDPEFLDKDGFIYGWTVDTLIPLPSTLLLLGSGLAGLGLWRARKRFKA